MASQTALLALALFEGAVLKELLLALLLHLVPRASLAHHEAWADAISNASDHGRRANRAEATALLVIAYYENSLQLGRGVPFGACAAFCVTGCSECQLAEPLVDYADASLRSWRLSARVCGADIRRRFGFYKTGHHCHDRSQHSRREARMLRRLLRRSR